MKRPALFIVLALIFLEWMDFSLYLYLAKSVFAREFFPPSTHSLMLSFALFAVAYFARPLGGWLFGRQADLKGRRMPMIYSAILMSVATLGICLLPGYAQWGIGAAWALLDMRVLQGLALGGEINTSAMFLIEHHADKPLIAGAYVAISSALGMFMGGSIATVLLYLNLSWGWRLVFAVAGLASLWVCRLRKRLSESPEFQDRPSAIAGGWQNYWFNLVNIAVLGGFVCVTVYICNVFWVSYAIDRQLWSATHTAWIGSCAQLLSAILALVIAHFAQPRQAPYLLKSSMVIAAITAPLLFYFTTIKNTVAVLLAIAGYITANGLLCSSLFYFLYLQLPVQYRCRGVSTVWALAASVGAFSLPLAEQAMRAGLLWLPGLLVSGLALGALAVLTYTRIRAYPRKTTDYILTLQ